MRRYIFTSVIILFGSACAFAQSILTPIRQRNNQIDSNYVRTYSFTAADAAAYNVAVEHFDGLGRKQAFIQRAFSPDKQDVASRVFYDEVGREWRNTLPATFQYSNEDSEEYDNDTSSLVPFSYGDSRPFSEIVYEASPLNRIIKEYGPGEKWKNSEKSVCTSYLCNGSQGEGISTRTGSDRCYHLVNDSWNIHIEPYIENQGYWPSGSLSVTLTTDESGRQVRQFRDEKGRLILTRRKLGNRDLDTYMVYDSKNRLVAVLPPMVSEMLPTKSHFSSSDEVVDRFAYLYMYDERDRCVAKKLPGCDWTYYIYDKGDRLIFTQDAEQRKGNLWIFTFLDANGRECITGTCHGERLQLMQSVSDKNVIVTRIDEYTVDDGYMGYSVSGEVSLMIPTVLSVSYYDDYSFLDSVLPYEYRKGMRYADRGFFVNEDTSKRLSEEEEYVFLGGSHVVLNPTIEAFSSTRWLWVQGRLTGKAERILGEEITNDFKWEAYYYDRKGNVIQSRTTRGNGGVDITATLVSFTGRPLMVDICHDFGGKGVYDEFYEYKYDNWDRLLRVRHKIEGKSDWTTVSNLEYDAIGRIISDSRTGAPGLKTSISYNVRSWKKKISGPGFSENLTYEPDDESSRLSISETLSEDESNDVQNEGFAVEPISRNEWGGNISSSSIQYNNHVLGTGFTQKYNYDDLSRLTSTSRLAYGQNFSQETYTFDDHTNIVGYNRIGVDDVAKTMTYLGNRMTAVSSSGNELSGSVSYDDIGRVISSDIEGMTEVQYNVTGFPAYIGQADGGYVHNTYAGGVRLASRRTAADGKVTTMNYEGNEVWENGKLRMLLFDGGYVDFSGTKPKYCWYTKDHLGNVRAVSDSLGYIVSTYDYRPYGEELSALPADEFEEPDPVSPEFPGRGGHGGRGGREQADDTPASVPLVNYSESAPKGWQPFRFGGKESLSRVGLDLYDFGARMYSPSNMRWLTMDPLCEKYYHISPYAYCAGNPVNLVDPDGREVKGVTRKDASQVVNDLRAIFSSKDFDKFRDLITQSGKRHNKKTLAHINENDLAAAFQGVELSTDQKALVELVVNTINSTDKHVVEYVSGSNNVSDVGADAFLQEFANLGLPMDLIIEKNGGVPAVLFTNRGGGGLTTSTQKGTHSVIVTDSTLHPNGRPVTTGHELFGHGRSLSLGRGANNQHVDAIQTENLILRVMGIKYVNDGSGHGPRKTIINATDLPSYR